MPEPNGELRRDVLTGRWVNVIGARQERPNRPTHPQCPFCPGGLEAPAPYAVHWFANRWPAFTPGPPILDFETDAQPGVGASEVILFSPDHDATLATLGVAHVRKVIDLWAQRTEALLARPEVEYVLVFENHGAAVGATIDHPHGQIYGFPFVPPAAAEELDPDRCRVCEERGAETADGSRMVAEFGDWVAYVPFAAAYPYALRIVSRRHVGGLAALDDASRDALAALLVDVLGRYERLFGDGEPFPYLLWFHQAPAAGGPGWHVHAHTAPPLRAPGVARFVASGELGSGTLANPVVPEAAAQALRDA